MNRSARIDREQLLSSRFRDDGEPGMDLNGVQVAARAALIDRLKSGAYPVEPADCVLCDGVTSTTIAEKDRYGVPMSVRVCQGCGLVRTDPRMTSDAYADFYDSVYRSLYVGTETASDEFFRRQQRRGRRILGFLRDAGQLPDSGALVLEVGAGAGGVLQPFLEEGYRVAGVDPGSDYVEFGVEHGIDLRVGSLHDWQGDRPSVIIMSHVFEHVLDPLAELASARSLLRSDGVLYVEVPSIKDLRAQYGGDLLRYLQSAHVWHFSPATLAAVMGRGGFDVVHEDDFVRSVYRPGTVRSVQVDDYGAVMAYLQTMERWWRRAAVRFEVALRRCSIDLVRSAVGRMGLGDLARRVRRTMR